MSHPRGERLSVAIVGAGRMGRVRAEGAAKCGARVAVACDADEQRAAELAAAHPGCAVLADPRKLDWNALDAVFVCTPPFARGPVELAAIGAGVPLLVEKPVGVTAEQVTPVAEALRGRRALTAVGYMNRYRPSVERAQQLLAGRPVLAMACNWIGTRYEVPWWPRPDMSGGPINEQATHLIDLGRYLAGEIVEVGGIPGAICNGAAPSTASISLRFKAGGVYSLLYSCDGARKMIKTQVFTPDMNILLDGWDFRLREPPEAPEPEDQDRYAVFHGETAAFLRAVERRAPEGILSTFEDALRTQRVVNALGRALRSGRTERTAEDEP